MEFTMKSRKKFLTAYSRATQRKAELYRVLHPNNLQQLLLIVTIATLFSSVALPMAREQENAMPIPELDVYARYNWQQLDDVVALQEARLKNEGLRENFRWWLTEADKFAEAGKRLTWVVSGSGYQNHQGALNLAEQIYKEVVNTANVDNDIKALCGFGLSKLLLEKDNLPRALHFGELAMKLGNRLEQYGEIL